MRYLPDLRGKKVCNIDVDPPVICLNRGPRVLLAGCQTNAEVLGHPTQRCERDVGLRDIKR